MSTYTQAIKVVWPLKDQLSPSIAQGPIILGQTILGAQGLSLLTLPPAGPECQATRQADCTGTLSCRCFAVTEANSKVKEGWRLVKDKWL